MNRLFSVYGDTVKENLSELIFMHSRQSMPRAELLGSKPSECSTREHRAAAKA